MWGTSIGVETEDEGEDEVDAGAIGPDSEE
jgi:hypothetical protein